MFIAIEGCDQAGKFTQAQLLISELSRRNLRSVYYGFPAYDKSPIARIIQEWLRGGHSHFDDATIELLYAAEKQSFNKMIENDLNEGIIVIADRHYYSGIAYASTRDISMSWACTIRNKLRLPDISLFLDVPGSIRNCRQPKHGAKDRLEASEVAQQQAYLMFVELCTRKLKVSQIVKVPAVGSAEEIHRSIIEILEERGLI